MERRTVLQSLLGTISCGRFGSGVENIRSAAAKADESFEKLENILDDLQNGRRGLRIVVKHLDAEVHLTPRR